MGCGRALAPFRVGHMSLGSALCQVPSSPALPCTENGLAPWPQPHGQSLDACPELPCWCLNMLGGLLAQVKDCLQDG